MSSLFPGIDKSWQPVVFLLCMLFLPTHAVFAADSYHVCTRTPRNNLTFIQQADGSIHYTFSGDLKCYIHYNYNAFHSLPHNGDNVSGNYRVEASFRDNRLHEQIWINMPYHYAGSPAIATSYTCQADPFRCKNPHCQKQQQTTPNPTEWRGAVEEAAGFTVPLSIGLASKSMPGGSTEPPAGQVGNPPPQQEDLAGPMVKSLVTDISFLKSKFSDDRREYFFSFSTPVPGRYEKLEAMATKYIKGQTVDVSLRGSGHQVDLTYKCNNIMDPFLDPDNECTLTGSSSPADSLRQGLVKQNYHIVYLFSHAISHFKRKQLIWEALAKSMQPKIFEGGKAAPADGKALTATSSGELMLSVESARDIRRSGDQPVLFMVENKKCPACSITDTEGNKIHFPLSSKYSGNSYNTTSTTIKNLEPGNYVYFTQIAASLTNLVSSKKIPFQITSHVAPKKKPVIVEPQENQQFKKESAVSIQVLVAKPMFGTGFDANIEIEHSRLAKQEAYKPLRKTLLENQGKESIVRVQYGFTDEDQNPITGDFRIRAQMVYDGKDVGQWSTWRHFHIGGKSIFRMHRGLSILSPKQDQTYTNSIPVKISLPETMKKEGELTLTWAMVGKSAARELIRKTVTVKPAVFFETKQDVGELLAKSSGEAGNLQLSISLANSNKHDSVQFKVPILSEPAPWGGNKMSGSLTLDTPIFTAPDEHQIFMAPAAIKVEMVHKPKIKISTELEYCPFATKKTAIVIYQPISGKAAVSKKEKGKTTLIYNLTKPGLYRIRACNNDKVAQWSAWRHFKLDTVSSGLTSTIKASQVAKFGQPDAPKILAPKNHATFSSDQPILLRVQNGPPKKYMTIETEKKSSGQDGQYKRDDLRRDIKATDKEVVEDISYFIWGDDKKARPGEYRIRVGFTYNPNSSLYANLNWSKWRYFRVLPALHGAPHRLDQKNILPGGGITKGQPAQKMINPQPEPPGKQARTLRVPLQVVPFAHSFHTPATVKISVKSTPFSRVPFELRYRSAVGKPYRQRKHPRHSFARTNGTTNLILSLEDVGQYQVRFRANHKAPWTPWQSFQVTGKQLRAAMPTHNMHISPGAARAINPQPEPPGRVMHNGGAQHMPTSLTRNTIRTTAAIRSTAGNIHITPPRIRQLHTGQKILLTGNKTHVKAQVKYMGKEQLQVEVQQEKQRRYITLRPQISLSKAGNITTADIILTTAGNYRLRVRAGNNRHWSTWTTFKVDKLMKNMPVLRHTTPQPKIKIPAHKPTLPPKSFLQPVH